ncbi:NlpC/P60 family protein [Cronobacter turicensis]|nr:C40 family peptidase [Cronobacter turicensis]
MRFLMIFFYFTSLLAAPAFSAALPPSWHYHDAAPGFSSRLHTAAPQHPRLKHALLSRYAGWKGTRYHLGGTTHRGVDCSALMQHLFAESASVSLPRTTWQQLKKGKAVRKTALQPGDLVFFSTGPRQRHVGVYIGDNQFIHASKEKGVTISSLSNDYWRARYLAARRVV